MSWCWLALLPEGSPPPRRDALAAAAAFAPDETPAGTLAAWTRGGRPHALALRADARVADPGGGPAYVSLVLPPAGVRLKFDDGAVQQARRRVLAGPPPAALTTFLTDASHFEGALTVWRDGWRFDPFAVVFPARRLRVEAGLLADVPPPAGPVIERYGSSEPWPLDRFPGSE